MARHRYSERPEQYEYLLTEKGRDLTPSLIALTAWGDKWSSPAGPPILYWHAACGGGIGQQIVCAECGPVDAAQVAVQPGPGMPPEYLAHRRSGPSVGSVRSERTLRRENHNDHDR